MVSKKNDPSRNMIIFDDETINNPRVKDSLFCPVIDSEIRGHGLVERDYSTHPQEMFAPPSDIAIIPESKWSDLIKENKAKKRNLRDLITWPALDQNGQGYAISNDSEVLVDGKGWVLWPEYNWTDAIGTVNPITQMMEFQVPTHRYAAEYDDEMIYSTNRRLDFAVTRQHRMYVRKWDERKRTLSNEYTFQQADQLGWYSGMMAAPAGHLGTELIELGVEGDRNYDGDDFLALLSLVISDGYAGGSESTRNWVSFCCFNPARYAQVAALAHRVGFKEQPGRKGVWTRYSAGALAEWVRRNCYSGEPTAHNKRLPQIVQVASRRQIKHFLDFYGDKSDKGKNRQFWTVSKQLVDDLQELHLRIGKRTSIGRSPAKVSVIKSGRNEGNKIHGSGCYCLTVSDTDALCIDRKKHIETDRYKGLVQCPTVPNGTVISRRNGSVLISGNCWAYSTTSAVMITRTIANLPYVRLSAHAIGCKVKNFRDQGGWCGLSAKFQRENGCPSVEHWPEKSMSRSNDKPETWANAKLHKVSEDFCDLTRDVYDQNLTWQQTASCLLSGIPCAVDFNHWSHSVCAVELVEVEPGSWGILILNSWGTNWSDRGYGILRGRKAIPNGAVAIRVAGASAK